jgi:hypothetical protein
VAAAVALPAALDADAAVELPDDPQAVISNATQTSPPPAAACRALRQFAVAMDFHPFNNA